MTNRDALLNFRNVLSTVEDRIQRLITARAPVSEILAASTADFDPIWEGGYVTGDIFVPMVLAGLGLAGNDTTTGAA